MKNHNLIFAIALTAMFFLIPLLGDVGLGYAQNVGINSTGAVANASAFLDIGDGTVPAGGDTKGLLIPRVALTITTSNAPVGAGIATSLLVYNTATVNDVTPGYYYWDGSQWVRFVSGVSGGGVPIGTIVAYGGASAPSDWLICDGSAVSRVTYANLFAVLGITYGAGDGVTTFNVPDLQQRFPLGKATAGTGSTLGATGGAIDHTHTGPSHTHTYTDVIAHTHSIDPPSTASSSVSAGTPSGTNSAPTFTGNALGTHNHTFSGNALAAHNHTFTGNALGTHNHTFTGNALPAHSHTYSTFAGGAGAYAAFTAGSVNTWDSFSTSSVSAGTPSGSISSVSAGTPSGSISSVSAGTPSGSISSVSAGTPSGTVSAPTFFGNALAAHSHTTDIAPFASASTGVAIGTTSADGTGTTGSNNPPFVVVNYIIKY